MDYRLTLPGLLTLLLLLSGTHSPAETEPHTSDPALPTLTSMILIPGGRFSMGTTPAQRETLIAGYGLHPSLFFTQPVNEVDLSAFYIDKHEVTRGQYKVFVEQTGHRLPIEWLEAGYLEELGSLPITGIDYEDAQAYAQWAGRRLPSDAEWERAARGEDGRLWAWGNEWQQGAYGMDKDLNAPLRPIPDPVESHPLDCSPYGVMDMSGNVSEWVESALPAKFQYCAGFRGGSFVFSQPFQFLVTARNAQPARNGGIGYIGFRCALDGNLDPAATAPPISTVPKRQVPFSTGEARSVDPPDPSRYGSDRIQILPIHDLDPTRDNYQNTLVCCYLPAIDGVSPATGPYVPWKLELRIPYLPSDRPAIFFENHWGTEMQHLELSADHTHAEIRSTLPGQMDTTIRLAAGLDSVDISYDVTNLTDQFMDSTVEMCMSLLGAPTFRDHDGQRTYMLTDHGFKRRNELPNAPFERLWCQDFTIDEISRTSIIAPLMQGNLIATLSRDRNWIVAPVSLSGSAQRLFNNWEYSCLHALPYSGAQPGERVQVKQRLYFLHGGLNALVSRYERDRSQTAYSSGTGLVQQGDR